jgi:uncharacterized membrane protein
MRRSGRVWLTFIGVFLAGAVAGGFGSLRLAHRTADRPGPDDLALKIMERYSERLQLTDEQRRVIQPHVERTASEMHRVRAQTAEIMEQLQQAVSRELTPEQRATLEVMQAEQRERWKKWIEKREQERKAGREPGHSAPGSGSVPEGGSGRPPAPPPPAR